MTLDQWREWMGRDKKVADGAVRLILLEGIGRVVIRGGIAEADLARILLH
jgi:3-dehydroquinate synthetase